MYHFYEGFKTYDDHAQPYSIAVERSSALPHTHAAVDERGFSLQCPGNKYLFLTPALADFTAELQLMFSPKFMASDVPYQWSLLFGYDEDTRIGYGLAFQYFANDNQLRVQLESVTGFRTEMLAAVSLAQDALVAQTLIEADVVCCGKTISGHYAGQAFSLPFNVPIQPRGSLGLSRNHFVGEVIFRSVSLKSDEETAVRELVPPRIMEIPPYNGGQLPYRLSLSIGQYDQGKTFVNCRLEGGLSDRPLLPRLNGQYLAAMDSFRKPYVRLVQGRSSCKIYLHPNTLSVLDVNVHWDFLKDYFECTDLPLALSAGLDTPVQNPLVVFGYDFAESRNFLTVSGGPTEYVFDPSGSLIYMGASLEQLSVTIASGDSKKIISMIPTDIPRYDEAVLHAVNNHYFFDDEPPGFDLVLRAPERCVYEIKARIEDAFYNKLHGLQPAVLAAEDDMAAMGVFTSKYRVQSTPLPLGVYHIVFEMWSGTELVHVQRAAFEVFDDDESHSPQKASGLPYLYSKCNEMRYLKHDVLDFHSPLKSYDAIHYFSLAGTLYADVGTELTIWRLFRLYRREWLVGLSGREVQYPHWSHWQEARRNASHVEYHRHKIGIYDSNKTIGINRYDLFKYETYQKETLKLMASYLQERPRFAEQLGDITRDFNRDKFTLFLKTCGADWLHWFSAYNKEKTRESYDELRALNPSIRFSGYSPYPLYAMPYGTHHTMLWFGYEPDLSYARQFNGVAQFEDYPYSCSYPTHRGALAGATLRLWCPNLNLTPELYRGSRGGCPDGLVGYANPPFGKYWMPPYFQATQLFEYVFATPVLNEDGFDYWRSYGAMFTDPDPYATLPEFLKRWDGVNKHKPVKPLKAMMFLTDYPDADERFTDAFDDVHGWSMFYNISEANQCHLYAAVRQSGLNVPVMTRFSCISQINAEMTDVLVLPSLCGLDETTRRALRRLYDEGIALVGCGSVEGLEDLFGVKPAKRLVQFNRIRSSDGTCEGVQPVEAEVNYEAEGASILLLAEQTTDGSSAPLLMRHGRTALLNIAAPLVGPDTFMQRVQYGRESISALFKDRCAAVLRGLSRPAITADCGLSAFSDGHSDLIMLFDYSPMTQIEVKTKVTGYRVNLHEGCYTDAVCANSAFPLKLVRENGFVREIGVKLRPQETLLIELRP